MAHIQQSTKATLFSAKQKILNKLCTVYARSKDNRAISADELRRELGIPENVFAEALKSFMEAENQLAIEVFERGSSTDLRLGESMRDLCSDWSLTEEDVVRSIESPLAVRVRRRSA